MADVRCIYLGTFPDFETSARRESLGLHRIGRDMKGKLGHSRHSAGKMLAYNGNRLSRRDVVARLPVILEGNCVEVLGEDLLTARESVAATGIMPRTKRPSVLCCGRMAHPEHVAKVREGVSAWNKWRQEHPDISVDLSRENLSGLDLEGANLSDAGLAPCRLSPVLDVEGAARRFGGAEPSSLAQAPLENETWKAERQEVS